MKFLILLSLVGLSSCCQHKGRTYKDGETWVSPGHKSSHPQNEQNAFKLGCKMDASGWKVEVRSCLTPDGLEVPANSTKASGQYEWECKVATNGQVTLKQKVGSRAACAGGHPFGSLWTDKSFQFRCDEGGVTSFVGCVLQNGDIIPDGGFKEVNHMKVECKKHSNGTVSMNASQLPFTASSNCKDSSGVSRRAGEQWTESEHFVKECKNGIPTVVACRVPELTQNVPLGGKVTQNSMDYFCEGTNGSYKFYSKVSKP